MELTRRRFLLSGAALTALSALGWSIEAERRSLAKQFRLISMFRSDSQKPSFVAALFSLGSEGSEKRSAPLVSAPLVWAPHSFFEFEGRLIAAEKEGPRAAVFDSSNLKLLQTIDAPAGYGFYGHGVAFGEKDSRRFVISGYKTNFVAGVLQIDSGFLFEYKINADSTAEIQKIRETDGFWPHDFAIHNRGALPFYIAYTLKSDAAGYSKVQICDPRTLDVISSIRIGDRSDIQRNATHLRTSERGLYYSYNEVDQRKFIGGGIGFIDWNHLDQPKYEVSYSNLLADRIGVASPDTLDLVVFDGNPTVVLAAMGSILVLNETTGQFHEIGPRGFHGIMSSDPGSVLYTSIRNGLVSILPNGTMEVIVPGPNGHSYPASHLCHLGSPA